MTTEAYTRVRRDKRFTLWPNVRREYEYVEGYKQKPITSMPLAFKMRSSLLTSFKSLNSETMNTSPPDCMSTAYTDVVMGRIFNPLSEMDNDMQRCYNRAYSKLFSLIGDSAEMGAALAEWRSTVDMVNNRTLAALRRRREEAVRRVERKALHLVKAYRALRRGKFTDFIKTLGVTPKKKHLRKRWSKPEEASSLWLEYWFGWSPTVSDIYNALKIWDSPYPDATFTAASGFHEKRVLSSINRADTYSRNAFDAQFIVRLQARVRVSNPNLYRMNQLGFVNPVGVVWELVPFSFLIDWFVNVGEVIGGYTSELGLELRDRQVMRLARSTATSVYLGNKNYPGYNFGWDGAARVRLMNREIGYFPTPSLTYTVPRLSWTRAATAISLLVSVFSHKLP